MKHPCIDCEAALLHPCDRYPCYKLKEYMLFRAHEVERGNEVIEMTRPDDLCFSCEANDFRRWLHCKVPCAELLASKNIGKASKDAEKSVGEVANTSIDSIKKLNDEREALRWNSPDPDE